MRLTPTEHSEQVCVVQWAHAHGRNHPLFLLTAIPNQGAGRNKRLQTEGTRAGFPDLLLPVARGGFHGLCIEMKTPAGRMSTKQLWWIERLREQGYRVRVSRSADAAIACLTAYLRMVKEKGEG
jgi:hypothetical protein